jgi:DHA3 family multidrug efflux protein-like MFS transporter
MGFVLIAAIVATVLAMLVLAALHIPEKAPAHHEDEPRKRSLDIRGTIGAVRAVPGLFALILFTTFNNFLGGVFFALMDAYGLTLMSVQNWGFLWGVLSLGFILGGLYIAKKGLGSRPLRILFRNNMITWTVCIFFTIQPSIILLAAGTFIWMFFVPFIEAVEQTIFQKVVPPERLGRVFGFAQSIEQAASPITAFLIGPIAQLFFIPFMTTGAGADLIGGWYGTGTGRGIGLVFSTAGLIGLIVTLVAMRSRAYELLSERFSKATPAPTPA